MNLKRVIEFSKMICLSIVIFGGSPNVKVGPDKARKHRWRLNEQGFTILQRSLGGVQYDVKAIHHHFRWFAKFENWPCSAMQYCVLILLQQFWRHCYVGMRQQVVYSARMRQDPTLEEQNHPSPYISWISMVQAFTKYR